MFPMSSPIAPVSVSGFKEFIYYFTVIYIKGTLLIGALWMDSQPCGLLSIRTFKVLIEMMWNLSYVAFDSAVIHGWVETEGQIINTEEKTAREINLPSV